MTNPDPGLLDRIVAEAEHVEATHDVEPPYRRRAGRTSPVYGVRLPAGTAVINGRYVEASVLTQTGG
ncbi:MAG: hypothetical protein ACRDSP_13300 [Pseudonocardiaceae bacterium]